MLKFSVGLKSPGCFFKKHGLLWRRWTTWRWFWYCFGHNWGWYASKWRRTTTKNGVTKRVTSEKDSNYKCQFWTKLCISKEALLRHVRTKHKDKATDLSDSRQGTRTSCQLKLKITELKDMYVKSAEKLVKDECYPVGVKQRF